MRPTSLKKKIRLQKAINEIQGKMELSSKAWYRWEQKSNIF
jgi:hypothetical protein